MVLPVIALLGVIPQDGKGHSEARSQSEHNDIRRKTPCNLLNLTIATETELIWYICVEFEAIDDAL